MHNALGLLGEQNAVFAIMLALGFAGIAAMFFALFVPGRWRVPYAAEVIFALIIFVLATGGAAVSQATVNEYWSDVPNIEEAAASGKIAIDYKAKPFDKAVSAYLRWRDLGYPQAEIRRMFHHRFQRQVDASDSNQQERR